MQTDELAEKVERELGRISPPPIQSSLEEIASAIESASGFKPVVYNDSYNGRIYSLRQRSYLDLFNESRHDMSQRVQLKFLNIHPKSSMGGVLGFTYLGDHSMGRRDDLIGDTARMVDIHESSHTPDEYETILLTDSRLELPSQKYLM